MVPDACAPGLRSFSALLPSLSGDFVERASIPEISPSFAVWPLSICAHAFILCFFDAFSFLLTAKPGIAVPSRTFWYLFHR